RDLWRGPAPPCRSPPPAPPARCAARSAPRCRSWPPPLPGPCRLLAQSGSHAESWRRSPLPLSGRATRVRPARDEPEFPTGDRPNVPERGRSDFPEPTQSEAAPLRWAQVDFAGGVVRLEPNTTKNAEGREFPMIPELRALLERRLALTRRLERARGQVIPWVFHRRGRPIKSLRRSWISATRAAGQPGLILHDLRRSAVRNLERAGISRSVAMRMTGHKTEAVYRRYAIVASSDLCEAARRLAALGESVSDNFGPLKLQSQDERRLSTRVLIRLTQKSPTGSVWMCPGPTSPRPWRSFRPASGTRRPAGHTWPPAGGRRGIGVRGVTTPRPMRSSPGTSGSARPAAPRPRSRPGRCCIGPGLR